MNWKEWHDWEQRRFLAVVFFIIAYIVTSPWRNYDNFFDTSQGVTIWMHLILIVAGIIVLLIGLKIFEIIIKKFILDKPTRKKNTKTRKTKIFL